MTKTVMVAVGFLMLSACASKPILLPNAKYNRVGHERSEKDVDKCIQQAENQLKKTQGRRILRGAGKGALIGGLVGGVAGSRRGGMSTAGGAVGGAAAGAAGGAILGSDTPEAPKRTIVNYCLRKKGYQVAGWD